MVGYCICGIFLSIYGGGYNMWEVPATDIVPYFKIAYAATLVYAPMTLSIKLSLLSLLIRIFAPYRKRIYFIYVLAAVLIIYYTVAWFLKIFVCWPISAYWMGQSEKCLDQSALITADSIINTVTDAIILVLPLPLTWSLQIPRNKKMRVGGMLAVGGLATAFSAWRLHLFVMDGNSPNMTILFIQLVMTGNAEAGIALICTCLPAVVSQFEVLRTRVGYGSSKSKTTDYHHDASSGHQLSKLGSTRGDRNKHAVDIEGSDEDELVMHAQGKGQQDQATAQLGGILRKVEVSHVISYATSSSSGESTSESQL
ncbi:hypothetical protein PSPO01_15586 [Paraphaeosphaeria sporulosa]